MVSDDIRRTRRSEHDLTETQIITLHQLRKPETFDPDTLAIVESINNPNAFFYGAHVDIHCRGTGTLLPPAIILDYMYGVAAYRISTVGPSIS